MRPNHSHSIFPTKYQNIFPLFCWVQCQEGSVKKKRQLWLTCFFSRERSQSFSMNYARTLWAAFLNLCTSFWFTVGNFLIKDSAPKSNIYWCWQLKIFFLTQINEIILTTVVLVFRTLGLTFVLLYRLWYSLYNISFNFS